jgi:hypothetical protein
VRILLALAASALATGCVAALAKEDGARLRDAQRAILHVYADDAAPPVDRAYARAGFCLVEKTLRSADAGAFDASAIACEEPSK